MQPNTPVPAPEERDLRFLALGDSYTIGQSVAESERWPVQLAKLLHEQGVKIAEPEIIAATGWTTVDLAAAMERTSPFGPFDIVTLMIGVNNQFQGLDVGEYRREFLGLLNSALDLAGGNSENVIVLSIPDYGVTPFAASLDISRISREIDEFSAVNQVEVVKREVAYVDVTGISRQAKTNLSLIAVDGLHPSGKMYGMWAELVYSQLALNLDGIPNLAPTLQPTSVPSPTTEPAAVPVATIGPTLAPTIHACRVEYPTPIVSGPSVPNPPQDGDRVFRSLTVHPTNPDIVLLGTERNGFMGSQDSGVTWSRFRARLRSDSSGYSEIWDIDFSASNLDIIMAATLDSPGPPTGPSAAAGLYRSSDGGGTWNQLNCGFTTSRVMSICIDPSNPERTSYVFFADVDPVAPQCSSRPGDGLRPTGEIGCQTPDGLQ